MAEKKIPNKHKRINDLTADFVRSILDYDPDTGIFTWKYREEWTPSRKRRFTGQVAGCITNGYVRIKIGRKTYLGHRLAWVHYHGRWPKEEIDHKNLNRSDNRIANLRESTISENARNKTLGKNNKSGYKGVSYVVSRKSWLAAIRVDKKTISLGWFKSAEEAAAAYCEACKKYHKDFARII